MRMFLTSLVFFWIVYLFIQSFFYFIYVPRIGNLWSKLFSLTTIDSVT
uniref:Uncharacterized protein n=1 Tax=Rhizophora mucronata TaxID=61149 RepID=A0A2P2PEI6_RHIMU